MARMGVAGFAFHIAGYIPLAAIRYKMNRDGDEACRFWVRHYAFSSHFAPQLVATGAQYSAKMGDAIDGLVAPSFGTYETC